MRNDGIWGTSMNMCPTCLYAESLSKTIQIRDVPDRVHSTLKTRAAREGMSLSDYLKRELARTAEQPSLREWLDRVKQEKPIPLKQSTEQIIREWRDGR